MNASDPRDLKADPVSGELVIEDGDLALISGLPSIRQDIEGRLSLVRGEWFLDTNAGIPLFDGILGVKAPKLAIVASHYRTAILGAEGVKSITSFSLSFDPRARVATLSFSVDTEVGALNVTTSSDLPIDAVLDDIPLDLTFFD